MYQLAHITHKHGKEKQRKKEKYTLLKAKRLTCGRIVRQHILRDLKSASRRKLVGCRSERIGAALWCGTDIHQPFVQGVDKRCGGVILNQYGDRVQVLDAEARRDGVVLDE